MDWCSGLTRGLLLRDRYYIKAEKVTPKNIFYLCKDKKNGNHVILRENKMNTPKAMRKYTVEHNIRSRLGQHPYICNYTKHVDIIGSDSMIKNYYVFEVAKGSCLESFCKGAKHLFSEFSALDITAQILLALEYCEKKQVLHSDIKLDNIFLLSLPFTHTQYERIDVMLGDFDCSVDLSQEHPLSQLIIRHGAPYYAGLEKLEHVYVQKELLPRLDIWGLGILLFIILVGHHPYDETDKLQLKTQLVDSILITKLKFPSCISTEMQNLVQLMLTKDFRQRPGIQELMEIPILAPHVQYRKRFIDVWESVTNEQTE